MRVIEVAHVEGQRRLLITVDGEPIPEWWSVTAHMDRKGTQIFINGVRVTEPTRVVRRGVVALQDNADKDPLVWTTDHRLAQMLSAAIGSIKDETPFKVPDLRESIEKARDAAQTAVYEPYVRVHHPQCRAVLSLDETQCEGYGCG